VNAESKKLFKQLLSALAVEDCLDEREAIVFWLMQSKLGLSRADVLANKTVDTDERGLADVIKRLNNHEPLQYILGEAEFYGRKFLITPDVLIPRPETELLVQEALDRLRLTKNPSIVDIGVGSGCIAITLALELSGANVAATDVSPNALVVAQKNASRLNAKLETRIHNILTEALGVAGLDAIVSNPPYVLNSERSTMQKRVREFEPHLALFVDDSDPLQFHKAIADKAQHTLIPGGFIILEINERLGPASASVLSERGFNDVKIIQDLDRKDRLVGGRKPS
jgi:release factor glutamine methyltransferase